MNINFRSDGSTGGTGFVLEFLTRYNSSSGASARTDCRQVYNKYNIPGRNWFTTTTTTIPALSILDSF